MIGVLTTSYPRYAGDFAGSFVRQRALDLVHLGNRVEVIAAGPGEAALDEGIRVHRIDGRPGGLFYGGGAPEALERPAGCLAQWMEAGHFAARMASEVAHRAGGWRGVESHWLIPSALVACALRLPHRAHAHGGDVFLLARLPGGASLARRLCRTGADLVFASAALRERFAQLCGDFPEAFGSRSWVESAPCDLALFKRREPAQRETCRRQLGLSGRVVLAAGRLVPIKGFDVLILALGRLPANQRPAAVIAGDGPERQRLQWLGRECGVDLRLPGMLTRPALADWMAAADLFVHPCRSLIDGRTEGAPVVVREALAMGLPVVASASGGLCELATRSQVVLVPADDPRALASAVVEHLGT